MPPDVVLTFVKRSSNFTQNGVTLSSAEAELVATCKLAAEPIGVLNILAQWGWKEGALIYADLSSALADTRRKGSGQLRHINAGLLWIQKKHSREELDFHKAPCAENPADMTKNLSCEKREEFCRMI